LNALDSLRLGLASLASVGAALGGFAVSQKDDRGLIDLAPALPPVLKDGASAGLLESAPLTAEQWASAFVGVPAAATESVLIFEPVKWPLVGVIGDSRSARAVFADPADASQTVYASAGDILPDGRVLGKITLSHVFFAAPPAGDMPAQTASDEAIELFSGPDRATRADAPPAP
jgi:hypothetical protein